MNDALPSSKLGTLAVDKIKDEIVKNQPGNINNETTVIFSKLKTKTYNSSEIVVACLLGNFKVNVTTFNSSHNVVDYKNNTMYIKTYPFVYTLCECINSINTLLYSKRLGSDSVISRKTRGKIFQSGKAIYNNWFGGNIYGIIEQVFGENVTAHEGDVFKCHMKNKITYHYFVVVSDYHEKNSVSFGGEGETDLLSFVKSNVKSASDVPFQSELASSLKDGLECYRYSSFFSKTFYDSLKNNDATANQYERYNNWYSAFTSRVNKVLAITDLTYNALTCNCQTIVDYIVLGYTIPTSRCYKSNREVVLQTTTCNWLLYKLMVSYVKDCGLMNKSNSFLDNPIYYNFNCDQLSVNKRTEVMSLSLASTVKISC